MPRGNGMGPMGMGRMTGRRAGFCAGYGVPGYANPIGFGYGYGYGYGAGRRFRRMYYGAGTPGWMQYGHPGYPEAYEPEVDEKEYLNRQAEFLEDQLDLVKKRLADFRDDD
ncbi:MAG: DUF5320 domain-containing protein [Clostridiales bacterium]|nr:DUF5320 domain-containing protein [Clostridiales bacterium]